MSSIASYLDSQVVWRCIPPPDSQNIIIFQLFSTSDVPLTRGEALALCRKRLASLFGASDYSTERMDSTAAWAVIVSESCRSVEVSG